MYYIIRPHIIIIFISLKSSSNSNHPNTMTKDNADWWDQDLSKMLQTKGSKCARVPNRPFDPSDENVNRKLLQRRKLPRKEAEEKQQQRYTPPADPPANDNDTSSA